LPLAVADDAVMPAEIDVLAPGAEPFHHPRPGAVEQAGHEMLLAIELVQDGADLVAREDDRPPGLSGVEESFQRWLEDDLVAEEQGAHDLIPGRGGDASFDRQMSEEGSDVALAHLRRMPLSMEYDEPPGKDVFRRVLMTPKPEAFEACFNAGIARLRDEAVAETGVDRPIIAIDGKTARRSHNAKEDLGPSGGVLNRLSLPYQLLKSRLTRQSSERRRRQARL
jgi:hypothetical protein